MQPTLQVTRMSTIGVQRQMKTENLVHAKRMIERTLRNGDLLTWNELLADDIVLSLKLGTLDTSRMGGLHGIGSDLEVNGQREAKSVLKRINGDLRKICSLPPRSSVDTTVFCWEIWPCGKWTKMSICCQWGSIWPLMRKQKFKR